ncbi:hypothetical protein ACIG5E_32625 [Kitasatospora sp. NPDC053057]|uniref:hypothetical protein n=1 Tax=Kitasatospora sp. NPDC053057 TaxID=3364062 RepID=UPI0037C8EEA7
MVQNGGEPSVMFCWAFLAIAALGSGPYALDRLLTTSHPQAAAAGTAEPTAAQPISTD